MESAWSRNVRESGLTRLDGLREFANKSAASAASPDYALLQAVIKSAASAASPRGGRASGRLDHGLKTRLEKKKKHPSSQAPAQARAWSPGPGPGPCEEGWKI